MCSDCNYIILKQNIYNDLIVSLNITSVQHIKIG
jgi:hypothetical protein